jgi:chemotaxis protein methyltransferase CheR
MVDLTTSKSRAFSLSAAEYRSICDRVYDLAGIKLGDQKQDLVYSRLSKRLRTLSLDDFGSYLSLLDTSEGQGEVEFMLNALTTNLTSFFREAHHFDHLKSKALKGSINQQNSDRSLRIWSSACSTGEEPYSIAMTVLESGLDPRRFDIRILATDINTDVLEQASLGQYSPAILSKCPANYRTYFQPNPDGGGEIKTSVKDLVRFRQLNLLGNWPMKRQFDIIFCRNVLIYFDNATKAQLVDRFVDALKPNGWLYLGHSESASGVHSELEPSGRTVYRKIS